MKKVLILIFTFSLILNIHSSERKLDIASSPIGTAMGNSIVASSSAVESIFYNPAGLAKNHSSFFSLNYNNWIADINLFSLLYGSKQFSGGLVYFSEGELTQATVLTAEKNSSWALIGSYGIDLNGLQLGLTGKYIQEKLFSYSFSGMMLDVGMLFPLVKTGKIQLGAVIKNIGQIKSKDFSSYKTKPYYDAGLSYNVKDLSLNLAVDNAKSYWLVKTGAQYRIGQNFAILLGYQNLKDVNDFKNKLSFGLTLNFQDFEFSVARQSLIDLGDIWKLSLTIF